MGYIPVFHLIADQLYSATVDKCRIKNVCHVRYEMLRRVFLSVSSIIDYL